MPPADPASRAGVMPKASGDPSSRTFDQNMKPLIAVLLLASSLFAGATEQLISTTTIGDKSPDVYEFYAESNLLSRYSTDSMIVPKLNVTPRIAASRVKNTVEKAYGFPIQNMIIQQIGSTPLASNPMKYVWFYSFFPQWIDAKGQPNQIPVLVLPNGDVVFPKRK